jgi:hypothetical protein
LSENEGEAAGSGRREPKRKTYFPRRRDRRAGWMGRRAISACGDGAAGGLAGQEAKRATGSAGTEIRKKEISELKLDF